LKTFHCNHCGSLVFFENTCCLKCKSTLGFLPERMEIATLEKAGEGQWRVPSASAGPEQYRLCGNGVRHQVCNWLVRSDDPEALCEACRLNQVIPDLSVAGNLNRWAKFETAKRRVLYTLRHLGLSTEANGPATKHPLRFSFLADPPGGPKILTGHSNGLITFAVEEADDDVREKRRIALKEVYRTLLGHVRHEIAHFYWGLLIERPSKQDSFRLVFGDERASYSEALKNYYSQGPPADWNQRHVSAYASAHPWEDWAETFAHYLHIQDMVETGAGFGLSLHPQHPAAPSLSTDLKNLKDLEQDLDRIISAWLPLTFALNEINRGMGLPDVYPFVLSELALQKLRFVHEAALSFAKREATS